MMEATITPENNLTNVMGFSDDDLAVNRDGKLSERQKSALNGHRWLRARGYFVFAFFFALIAALPLLRYFTSATRDGFDLLGGGAFAAFALLLIGLGVNRWRQVQKDIQNGVVNSVNGKARVHIKRMGRGLYEYKLKVEGLDFILSQESLAAFTEGQSYRVFYTPIAQIVVAAEPS